MVGPVCSHPNRPIPRRQDRAISAEALLQARRLTLAQPPLGPLDLALYPGETTLLAGPSGSGKSRLLRALADLDRASGGELLLEGRTVREMSAPAYRSRVAYLPATPQLGSAPVKGLLEQVAAFQHRRRCSDPRTGLERLGLPESILERSADELSSGETVRVALALLLSGDAEVLLLDEPTGTLDPRSARAVEERIQERAREDTSILWVSHDPDQAGRIGDALLTLEGACLNGPLREPRLFPDTIRRLDPEATIQSWGAQDDG
ncbi:ABC transporter ATP-binding protein [Thiohalorhabdus sp.]|uniref:ABC transporter ATP-binding protein n=1 Tax=Thiohalorhabdus sp. TaxID=3094134 RepID=UPI002FC3A546